MISEDLSLKLQAIQSFLSGLVEPFPRLRVLEKHIWTMEMNDDVAELLQLTRSERDYYKFRFEAIRETFK